MLSCLLLSWLCTKIIWCTCISLYNWQIHLCESSITDSEKNNNLSKHDFMLMNWNVSQFFFSCLNGCMNKNMKNIIISIFFLFLFVVLSDWSCAFSIFFSLLIEILCRSFLWGTKKFWAQINILYYCRKNAFCEIFR